MQFLNSAGQVIKRQRTTCLIVFPLILLGIAGSYYILKAGADGVRQDLIDRGTLIAGQFPDVEAANWLARSRSSRSEWQIESLFKLKAILMSAAENRDVIYALISDDKDGVIKAHTIENLVGSEYQPVSGKKISSEESGIIMLKYTGREDGRSLVDVSTPVYYGKGEKRLRIGTFHFGLSHENVDRAVKKKNTLFPVVSFVLLLLGSALILARDKASAGKKPLAQTDGSSLGPYVLEKRIAAGGMGELFLARKEIGKFKMRVAVKRILSERADDKDYITALLDEANLASQLKHPNIATLHDFGNIGGQYFIAMEFIDGENLLSIMNSRAGAFPVSHVIYIMEEVCKGLDYAHNKVDDFSKKPLNIVHRDVSPQNILISVEGSVKIVDFGIARAAQRQSKKTTVGIVKGKLHYMSPEQASASGEMDRRSDIFSLGLICHEMLSGHKVYDGDTLQEILRMACNAEIAPVGEVRRDVPEELSRIIMKCLAPDLSQRYQTAKDVYEDLVRFVRAHPDMECSKAEMAKFMQEMGGNKDNDATAE
ncbi:MAG: serine/threonine-protein kinase [Nitrospirota bacterium]